MIRLEMKNYNTILTEKQQKKKKQALPSGKIDKCEWKYYPCIKGSFPLGKVFEKQIKTNEYQRIKQIAAWKPLKPEKKIKN